MSIDQRLVYQIEVHVRLLILKINSHLHSLILVCTYIIFEEITPLHIHINHMLSIVLGISGSSSSGSSSSGHSSSGHSSSGHSSSGLRSNGLCFPYLSCFSGKKKGKTISGCIDMPCAGIHENWILNFMSSIQIKIIPIVFISIDF